LDSKREPSRRTIFGTSTNDGENRRQKEMERREWGWWILKEGRTIGKEDEEYLEGNEHLG